MLHERFAALLQSLGPFPPAPHFAIALSGGADSLALTLLAQHYVAQNGGRITTLTVDHRLRAESSAEAQSVADLMHTYGIDHHILIPAHDGISSNLQAAARNWRYAALSRYCHDHGILHCLVGHNAGDNRETVAHNIARGTTADGTSGMRSSHNLNGVRFLRPLLSVERLELEEFLISKRVAWVNDPSNENTQFARVRNRRMLKQNPTECVVLDTVIDQHRLARTARDQAFANAAMQCVTVHSLGFADINLEHWHKLDGPLPSQILADCITTVSGNTTRPRRSDTERLVAALQRPFTKRTLQQCELTLQGNRVRIAREFSRVAKPVILTGTGQVRWDARFTIHYAIPASASYTLAALGHSGRKQAKAQWGTIADVPLSTPALWHLDELVLLPHIEVPHSAATQVRMGFTPPKPLAAAPFW